MNLVRVCAESGDWEAVYDGDTGRLLVEGHTVTWEEIARLLGSTVTSLDEINMEDTGRAPSTLAEVQKHLEETDSE
jgi:hypothetical protein